MPFPDFSGSESIVGATNDQWLGLNTLSTNPIPLPSLPPTPCWFLLFHQPNSLRNDGLSANGCHRTTFNCGQFHHDDSQALPNNMKNQRNTNSCLFQSRVILSVPSESYPFRPDYHRHRNLQHNHQRTPFHKSSDHLRFYSGCQAIGFVAVFRAQVTSFGN